MASTAPAPAEAGTWVAAQRTALIAGSERAPTRASSSEEVTGTAGLLDPSRAAASPVALKARRVIARAGVTSRPGAGPSAPARARSTTTVLTLAYVDGAPLTTGERVDVAAASVTSLRRRDPTHRGG